MEEATSTDTRQEIHSEDKLVLLTAVSNDTTTDVVTRLISPSNINLQDTSGNTALHGAVRKERWELVPVLLQHGADVNIANQRKQTPLHWAVRKKRWELVPVLLQYGADVNLCTYNKHTALHLAAQFGAPTYIIARLISPHNINLEDEDVGTALHNALKKKRWELVPILLQYGADVHLENCWYQTPLRWAALYGAPADIITRLISPQNINMQDADGDTALHNALRKKRWELVAVLLQHGADVNLCNDRKQTPLDSAMHLGAPIDNITRLISPHNINKDDGGGGYSYTALHKALTEERWDLVPVLLQHGADVNLVNRWKLTTLCWSVLCGAPADIIIQLISPHNINMKDRDGNTVLHNALRKKRWELVPILLQHGADPFIPDILPGPTRPFSLQSLCIMTIRSHIPVKSDETFEGLGLPKRLLSELKLKPLADEIVAIKNLEGLK